MIESVGWDASISHTLSYTKDCKKVAASGHILFLKTLHGVFEKFPTI
jgi:hypothetical protein